MDYYNKYIDSSGGGGVPGLTSASGGTAIADNAMIRGDGTTGIQGSVNIVSDAGSITMADGSNITNADYIRAGSSSAQKVAINRGSGTGSLGLALASDRSIGISSGASSESGFDVELLRTAAGVWRLGDGASGFSWLQTAGFKRKTADQTVTDSTTLVDDTHLTVSLAAGRTYKFRFVIHATTVATSGLKYSLGGTATHTNIISYNSMNDISGAVSFYSRFTATGSTSGRTSLGPVVALIIEGTTTVNAAGTFLIQFAQNAETGAAETATLLRGSTLEVWDIA